MLSSVQIRAARGCLAISQVEVSKETEISLNTIYRLESDPEAVGKANMANIKKIKVFFEKRGIKFLPPSEPDGTGEGVRYFPNRKEV
jgi:hypothetical protein